MTLDPPTAFQPGCLPCCQCGRIIDARTALLSGDGPVCDSCQNRTALTDQFTRAAKYYSTPALTAAVVSLLFNPFFLFSLFAIVLGIRGAVRLTSGQLGRDYAEALGPRHTWHVVACLAAVVLPLGFFALHFASLVALRLWLH